MTAATLAPVSGNQAGIWIVIALAVVLAIAAVLWQHEVASDRHDDTLAEHDQQLATLAGRIEALAVFLGVEINDPVEDDSPEALENLNGDADVQVSAPKLEPDDAPTDEFPIVQPDTAPMALVVDPTPAVQARRDAAWDQQRPSPVPRKIEYVERVINIGGTLQTYRIPAKREEAS